MACSRPLAASLSMVSFLLLLLLALRCCCHVDTDDGLTLPKVEAKRERYETYMY